MPAASSVQRTSPGASLHSTPRRAPASSHDAAAGFSTAPSSPGSTSVPPRSKKTVASSKTSRGSIRRARRSTARRPRRLLPTHRAPAARPRRLRPGGRPAEPFPPGDRPPGSPPSGAALSGADAASTRSRKGRSRASGKTRRRRAGGEDGVCPHRSEEHTSELQSRENLVCRLLLEKKKIKQLNTSPTKKKKPHNEPIVLKSD